MKTYRIILSGGGTGGHIYPAVAVAEALKRKLGDSVELLFVGAEGKMEMEKVPALGYEIKGLPVAGLQRRLTLSNLKLPFKIWRSVSLSRKIIRGFGSDMVVGFGGYASGPVLWSAQRMGVPTVIQEQNSYAGVTNKMLGKRARRVCVAYEGMERFFPADRIVMTGNPLRGNFGDTAGKRAEALEYFGFEDGKPVLLIVGGSLGTRTLNEAMKRWVDTITEEGKVQVIWQTGKFYEKEMDGFMAGRRDNGIWRGAFIERMDYAYAAADVVISRSGAGSVSELSLVGKPVIFVPSPNVAEDHQTKNAMALVDKDAAMTVPDAEAVERAIPCALELLGDEVRCRELAANIRKLAVADSADRIASIIMEELEGALMEAARNIYFLGIGGIGMSAIARYFMHEECNVAGYDRTSTPLTDALAAEGADIHFEEGVEFIPGAFRDPQATLVVYTPAVPADHAELVWFRGNGFTVEKRSEMLGHIAAGKYVMAVAGTHGKTTTTTLTAWLNHAAACGGGDSVTGHENVGGDGTGSAFLGGISKNFGSNLVLGTGNRLAVEADEFDRSFLRLFPDAAVITSTDADHLDIYGTHEAMKEAFAQFAAQVKPGGTLVVKRGAEVDPLPAGVRVYSYALDGPADFYAENVTLLEGGRYRFDVVCPDRTIADCSVGVPGIVNVENAVAAVALMWAAGFDEERLRQGLASFSGVKRRFEQWINTPRLVYMDDYAHHPRELSAAISSIRGMFPGRRLTAVFQPHLYTRTRDFHEGFASALSLADEVVLLPIYPARELPIEGIDSQLIGRGIAVPHKVVEKDRIVEELAGRDIDVVVTFGAGDIDAWCAPIARMLAGKYNVEML